MRTLPPVGTGLFAWYCAVATEVAHGVSTAALHLGLAIRPAVISSVVTELGPSISNRLKRPPAVCAAASGMSVRMWPAEEELVTSNGVVTWRMRSTTRAPARIAVPVVTSKVALAGNQTADWHALAFV